MKIYTALSAILLAGFTTACGHQGLTAMMDKHTTFTARVEGAPDSALAGFVVTRDGKGGASVHRTLRKPDGTVLFVYDAEIHGVGEPGNYRVTLKPVKGSPSFAANREVAAKVDEDEVRVELVEDAVSHRKIVDVLKLSTETPIDPMNSLIQFHNHIFRMVHGK